MQKGVCREEECSIVPENMNYVIRELEMEVQMQQARKDWESDDPADADLLFAVQLPEPELTAEEQNGRLAIAGATYGAIREIVFSEEEWERRMNRRA